MKRLSTAIVLLLTTTFHLFAQDTARADAALAAATVYFGYGAELTHNAKVNVNASTKIIVISQLSTSIDINSLQINLPENAALLSQQFSLFTPTIPVVTNPLIKKLQDSIKLVQKEQGRNKNMAETEQETLNKTNTLIEIAMKENSSKTISSEEAIKLINANTTKIERSKAALYKLAEEYDALQDKITAFQIRINEAQYKPVKAPKPYGQLTLQVICSRDGEIPVSFSYFTNTAGFTPLYDVRVNSKTNEIKLVYKAAITQSTGIDWKQTKLTLSTANPSWGGVAPILTPWYLQQYVPGLYKQVQQGALNLQYNTIQSFSDDALKEVVVTANGATRKEKALAVQHVDPSTLQRFTTLTESQLNTNFEIDLPYNIESDGQVHSVTIKEEKIDAVLKNYAVPKMDKDAYLLAEITDWQKLDLLPGVANIIMDNTYLGKSMIDPNSTADTMNLSLGKDKRVAIKRSAIKEYTSTKTSGSATKQTFTYELTVKNNKITDVDLLLKDQYPISTIKDIETKLEDSKDAMVNTETGVLTWKISLKPGESKKVRFTYTVKYPKEIRIANL
ncbi:MAG: DUF4139 domain-containing protein [Chitinophagaceae bacterium]|nr:DUF4139 domain-containing protein [Chitinophagaceae bacterium]